MQLEEQLQKVVLGEDDTGKKFTLGIPETEKETKLCIKIVENFAIGFAEFCRDGEKNTEFWYKEITIKQLLEIYKKTL